MGIDAGYGIGSLKPGVCTSTTRPVSPYNGQSIYETDTKRTLTWDGSNWLTDAPFVCTSSTRPSAPYNGQLIYETNTALVKAYNGASWVTIGPYTPTATVQMGSSNVATSQTITSASYQDLGTVQSVTLTTGTLALISVAAMFTRPSPETNWWMGCAVSGATTIAASDDLAAKGYSYGHSDLTISRSWVVSLTAGSNTFTAKFRRDSTNANAYNRSLAVVAL